MNLQRHIAPEGRLYSKISVRVMSATKSLYPESGARCRMSNWVEGMRRQLAGLTERYGSPADLVRDQQASIKQD